MRITGLFEASPGIKAVIITKNKWENMSKILYIFVGAVLLVIFQDGFAQTKNVHNGKKGLLVEAKVSKLIKEIQGNSERIAVTVSLIIEFVNNSEQPIIMLTQKCPYCPQVILTRTQDPAVGENILYDLYRGPSISKSSEWENFRSVINQSIPPQGIFKVLKPRERWSRDIDYTMSLPINKLESYRADRPAVDWDVILKNPTVWLRFGCDVWPFNVESDPWAEEFRLGNELQKKWLKYGLLQLDSVVSEPIELNLQSLGLEPS